MIDFTKASTKTGQIERDNIALIQDAYQGAYNDIQKDIQKIYTDPKNLDANGNLIGAALLREKRFMATQGKIVAALDNAGKEFSNVLTSAVKETYKVNFEYGEKSLGSLETGIDFGMINREAVVKAAVSPLALTAVEENATAVIAAVKKTIVSGIVSGASINTMATRIQQNLQANANNAVRIARTETTRVMGEAREQLLKEASDLGLHVIKVWIATSDDRTRESHVHINGEERELDQPFSNGLMFPGDTSTGDPGETINCRCAMAAKTIPTPSQAKAQGVTITGEVRKNDTQMQNEYNAWKAAKALAKNNVAKVTQPQLNIKDYSPLSESNAKQYDDYIKKLPSAQKDAINEYTHFAYSDINDSLRSEIAKEEFTDIVKDILPNLDEAFRNAPPLANNTIVKRNIDTESYELIFGSGTEELILNSSIKNGVNYSEKSFIELKKRLIGSTIKDNGFISTTNDYTEKGILSFALPKGYNNGMYIASVSDFIHEQEFLLNRGQTFVVRDIIHSEDTGLLQIILGPKP